MPNPDCHEKRYVGPEFLLDVLVSIILELIGYYNQSMSISLLI